MSPVRFLVAPHYTKRELLKETLFFAFAIFALVKLFIAPNNIQTETTPMGRNKFSANEIKQISRLLRLKNAGNRYQQKLVRHDLRVDFEFNISDFNEPGKAFGEEELQAAINRGAIIILDDATIEAMKAKRARDKARDQAQAEAEAVATGEQTDWQEALKEWNDWEQQQKDDAQ